MDIRAWNPMDAALLTNSSRIPEKSRGSKVLHHPVAGELTLDWDALTCTTDPDQQLVVWTAEPAIPSHDGLRILASWAAEHPEPRLENGCPA